MCIVSNTGDYFTDRIYPTWPPILPDPGVNRAEFLELKRQLEELKKLLVAAKKFDKAMGEPECEMDDKVALIKRLAKELGVDLGDIFE